MKNKYILKKKRYAASVMILLLCMMSVTACGKNKENAAEENVIENAQTQEDAIEGVQTEENTTESVQTQEDAIENVQAQEDTLEGAQAQEDTIENVQTQEDTEIAADQVEADSKTVADTETITEGTESAADNNDEEKVGIRHSISTFLLQLTIDFSSGKYYNII